MRANVKSFGALGNGIADDTSAIQRALDMSPADSVYFPGGTYLVSSLRLRTTKSLTGTGTLKQRPGSGDILTISGLGTVVEIDGLRFDGNEQNQTPECLNKSLYFTATDGACLTLSNVTFLNGCWADVSVYGSSTRSTGEGLILDNCKFLGGREGTTQAYAPRYVDIRSPINFIIKCNLFNRLQPPVVFGRAGILVYDGYATTFESARGVITGNTFVRVGRSQARSTLGAIDFYDCSRCATISSNTIIEPYGRGIQTKADGAGFSVSNNTIDKLLAGSDGTMGAQIVVNGTTASHSTVNGAFSIIGNVCLDSGNDGISVTGRNDDSSAFAKGFLIAGNTVSGAARRGLSVTALRDCRVDSNVVMGATIGLYADGVLDDLSASNNTIRDVTGSAIEVTNSPRVNVRDNDIFNVGGRGVSLTGVTSGRVTGNDFRSVKSAAVSVAAGAGPFRVEGNVSDATVPTPLAVSGCYVGENQFAVTPSHKASSVKGVLDVITRWHTVDSDGSDLLTITGGIDGGMVTLRPSKELVVTGKGGNLLLVKDFKMSTSNSLTLTRCGDTWVEIGRA